MSGNTPSNDEQIFNELYHEHYSHVVKSAVYMVKDTDAAEDLTQNVFLKLWDQRSNLSQILSTKSYLSQMIRNACLDYLKANPKPNGVSLALEYEASQEIDKNEEIRLATQKAISHLAPQCRLIFSLSRFEGLANDEIAEYLTISQRTVETQISSALKRFRTDLRHYFIELMGLAILMSQIFTS